MAGVILDTVSSNALIAQTIEEGLLSPTIQDDNISPDKKLIEKALQAILMLGPALIFRDDKAMSVSKQSLCELNIFNVAPQKPNSFPIYNDSKKPTEEQVEQFLQELEYLQPFIEKYLYRTLKDYLEPNTLLEKAFNLSYDKLGSQRLRSIAEQLPEIAILFGLGSEAQWESRYQRGYTEQAIELIEGGGLIDETLLPTILFTINEPKKLLAESSDRQLPVLGGAMFRLPFRSAHHDISCASSLQPIVNITLTEAGYELPKITSVSQLLELDNDDRVISLRHFVKKFIAELSNGHIDSIPRLQNQLNEASKALRDVSKLRRRTRWSFLVPLATGVVETLIGLLPSASVVMTLGIAGSEYALRQKEKKHLWTLLLSRKAVH